MGCWVEGELRASRSPAPPSPWLSISQRLAAPLSLRSYRAPRQNHGEIIVCLLLGPQKSKEKMRFCLLALDHGVFLPCRAGFHVPMPPIQPLRAALQQAALGQGLRTRRALMSPRGKFQHCRPKASDVAHGGADSQSLTASNLALNSAWTRSTLQTKGDVPLDPFNLVNPGAVCVLPFNHRRAGNPHPAAVGGRSQRGSCVQAQLRSTWLLLPPPEQQKCCKINYP